MDTAGFEPTPWNETYLVLPLNYASSTVFNLGPVNLTWIQPDSNQRLRELHSHDLPTDLCILNSFFI